MLPLSFLLSSVFLLLLLLPSAIAFIDSGFYYYSTLYISFGYLIFTRLHKQGEPAVLLFTLDTLHPHTDTHAMPSTSSDTVRRALEIARDSTDGYIEPKVNDILEAAIADVRRKLEAQPDSYVLSRDEFALFNYYRRSKFSDSPLGQKIAQKATERFWNNYKESSMA